MIKTKTLTAGAIALSVVAIALAVVAIGASRADAATTPKPKPVCPTWTLQSIVTEWGDPSEGSEVKSFNKVVLTKPTGGGTEFATRNLDLEFDTPVDIVVFYTLDADADYAAGAVRLFYYEEQNADTLTTAPKAYDAAMSKIGVLKLSGVTKVGTLGLVYDASNAAAGKVTFHTMTIGKQHVWFKDVCPKPSPSVTPSASPSASATPTPSASTSSPAPSLSVSTSPASGTGGGSLPVTGAPMYAVAGVGLVLVVAGVVGLVLSRRRRERFEA